MTSSPCTIVQRRGRGEHVQPRTDGTYGSYETYGTGWPMARLLGLFNSNGLKAREKRAECFERTGWRKAHLSRFTHSRRSTLACIELAEILRHAFHLSPESLGASGFTPGPK
jgi:hypothetical protein